DVIRREVRGQDSKFLYRLPLKYVRKVANRDAQTSPDLRQIQGSCELRRQRFTQRPVLGPNKLRVRRKQSQRILFRQLQQFHLVGYVGQFELRQAVLAGAEEFAGAAQLEVH